MSGDVTQAGVLPEPNWSMWTRPLNPTKPHPATDLGHAGMWRREDDKFICYTGDTPREVTVPPGLVRLLPDMPLVSGNPKAPKSTTTKASDLGDKELGKQWAVKSSTGVVLTKESEKEARDFRREFSDYELLVRVVGEWETVR